MPQGANISMVLDCLMRLQRPKQGIAVEVLFTQNSESSIYRQTWGWIKKIGPMMPYLGDEHELASYSNLHRVSRFWSIDPHLPKCSCRFGFSEAEKPRALHLQATPFSVEVPMTAMVTGPIWAHWSQHRSPGRATNAHLPIAQRSTSSQSGSYHWVALWPSEIYCWLNLSCHWSSHKHTSTWAH